MRPKILVSLAACALALTACSSTAEPGSSSVPSDPAAAALATAPPDSVYDPKTGEVLPMVEFEAKSRDNAALEASKAAVSPEQEFLQNVRTELEPYAEYFADAVPAKVLTDKELLKRGKDLCKQIKNGTLNAGPQTNDAGMAELEKVVRIPASAFLCPAT